MTAGTTMYTCERPVVHHLCLAPSRHVRTLLTVWIPGCQNCVGNGSLNRRVLLLEW